ncbi:MAG TPA: RdgB/HAM1 family non-canonical purine NTP pyrophosphatase [Candidatus Acidoferrales bacterium]|nr:RdgB/HAM1 family non-canonical purine NTP pyrophosphatase [Candidatus Acidoferrales bacterium]
MSAPARVLLATSNAGKLREYRALASPEAGFVLDLLSGFGSLPRFDESAPTFAENAAGKALHYSRFTDELVLGEDSGLVVPALGGAPGPFSARYAGPEASDSDRVGKLLAELEGKAGDERRARFVAVVALAKQREAVALFSDYVEGVLTYRPRGENGFGYDPIFLIETLGRTFAELAVEEKNLYSHRARAFRKAAAFLGGKDAGRGG